MRDDRDFAEADFLSHYESIHGRDADAPMFTAPRVLMALLMLLGVVVMIIVATRGF